MNDESRLSDEELIGVSGGTGLPEAKYCWNRSVCPRGYWEQNATNEEKTAACTEHKCRTDPSMGKVYCQEGADDEAGAVTLIGQGKSRHKRLTRL